MHLNDLELVTNIQNHQDVESSLKELVDRHSGIYYDIINKLVPAQSTYCNKNDLFSDREFNIYNAALKFDSTRGAKFSTFLGNETRWVCLNAYNKARKKPIDSRDPQDLDFLDKIDNCDIIDQTLLNEIYSMVEKHPDGRVGTIFRLRYKEGLGNKVLPWKDVSPHVNLSIQGCINVHDAVIKDIKRKLKQELINE